ncbi:Fibrinogen C domain-containing protein 1 [Holothuria leucospilota]|uniref:Fibrinogen C domain-containing protein 1 n=1 Tax=Holothuria leucospilota TaxID=206669 RepID=A0A9Q1H5N1_HOLLE|nr:Fibrinogen C domain-containing protein 1 [Holothuria leucospilota]
MVFGHCECQPTCNIPQNTTRCISSCDATESCICADGFLIKGNDCVSPNECGCYAPELYTEILNGDSFVNFKCSEKCTCNDDQLHCNSNFECSPNATCKIENGVRNCYCNEGYQGNGEICSPLPTDCYDAYEAGHGDNGVYTILPSGWPGSPFKVSCVMSTNGGGWTVFQRRTDGVTDFYQNWTSYRYGFGSLEGEFWLGNEHLHYLTNQKNYTLRIDIVTSEGSSVYDEYLYFRISNESNKFRIDNIGTHNGTAGNGMYNSGGYLFSTYDQDNDGCGNHQCAKVHRGAWWYANDWCPKCLNRHCHNFRYNSTCSGQCTASNLNGEYNGGNGENIFWANDYSYCNLIFTEMKIRPFEH